MGKGPTLPALLDEKNEPSIKSYNETVEDIIKDPQQLRSLTDDSVRDDILIVLTTHSHRLAQFFRLLRSTIRAKPKSPVSSTIAIETVNLLVNLLPHLHQLLGPTKTLEYLIPALDICLVSSQPPLMRKLASVLADCNSVLEHLASDASGVPVLRQLACILSTSLADAPVLEAWTERLVRMVGSCKANHDVAQTIRQSGTLRSLKCHLRSLEAKREREPSGSIVQKIPLPFSSMTKLSKEDKKTQLGREHKIDGPTLDENVRHDLNTFHLPDPKSWAALRNVIESLEGDETSHMLLAILDHFPCELCILGLGSAPRNTDASPSADDCEGSEDTERVSDPQIEILGSNLGIWQILLTKPALSNLKELSSQGLINSVASKLRDLASGCWSGSHTTLTGTEAQRKRLKVPLFATEFGPGEVILWQVDVGTTRDHQVPEQVIKIWTVGSLSKMDKVFNSVTLLQRSYTSEAIRRCRERPFRQDMRPFPVRFETSDSRSATADRPVTDLDVRTVDQDTIEMANKFYALTEPVFKAIVNNDLMAEFPFDLSTEEFRILSHSQTASMILGRSGTGKTTCLIFKLVGKYLASKAVVGETSVKQVLVTRSTFLADRLRAHTKGLIRTLDAESLDAKPPPRSEDTTSMTSQEKLGERNVHTLTDDSFPLVLAFDDFLTVLENTAETFDRKDTSISEVSSYGESAKPWYWRNRQLVDFYTFKVDYWPGLPRSLTRSLSVNLVFSEIMGVIKGSASSGKSLTFLSRQDYLNRSCRLAPVFKAEDERSVVYDIFERYEEMKKENQDVDNVDRVVRIMRAIRRNTSLKQLLESTFDEVYIDEVQDQRCIDVQLFLEFIKDSRGLHFAGDTAQAISQDSTFRFSDVKAIIYEHFMPASIRTKQSQISRTTMFTLSKNYRSHRGILALASLIMKMIWKGFPETVDNLEPEAGDLDGPKPVLFLGCDASILLTSNVGLVNLTDRSADYGAEQVILVRDEAMKTKLQAEIGDIALILTILDSKGMEFDDVILWDFFTSSPDPSGVRSLHTLATGIPSAFDVQRYSGMCSELKHLYVAITRAKIQLFLLESSEKAMVTIVELLTSSPSGSLVDVTRPHEQGFAEKLKMLRPGTSVDSVKYSLRGEEFMQRRNFESAVWCFHRANNDQREDIAKAKMFEAKGRNALVKKDIQGATQYLEAAIELFLKTNEISDAAENLERLTRFVDAAELWLKYNKPTKAAALFAKAGLYVRAADCHHIAGDYCVAAAVLRSGGHYDEMVSYLCDNREAITADTFRSFSLLCKILLKKNRISSEHRKYAFEILGTSIEQEACFIEYGMDAELANLYSSQHRHKDIFYLCTRKGDLGRALNIAISKNLLQDATDDLESRVLSLLDYIWVGHLEKNRLQYSTAPLKLPQGYLTHKLKVRVDEWDASNHVYGLDACTVRQQVSLMKDTVPKTILCLRNIVETTSITRVTKLDDLPFEMMHETIKFAKQLTVAKDSGALKTLLIFSGVWKPSFGLDASMILPWSPIREALTKVTNVEYEKVAMELFLHRFMSAILEFDVKARDLWRKKWQRPCVLYMALGFCPRNRSNEECKHSHQFITPDDCSRMIDDLLQISSLFCNLALLYHRHSLGRLVPENYMKIKRYWLERVLRELTYLSAVEQHSSAIVKAQTELRGDSKFIAVSSSLEGLLYHRLGSEWMRRGDFTSLLEQMQLAKVLGTNVHTRLLRALSYKLYVHQRHLMIRHLRLLDSIKGNLDRWTASIFQDRLLTFLGNLENIEIAALSTLHALTAEFEFLVAFLTLKLCVAACVIPSAWVDLHIGAISKATHSTEPLQPDDRHRYQQCLVHLGKSFCQVLSRLNTFAPPPPTDFLLCNGDTHLSLLLRQRNAELVAFVVVNLVATLPEPPFGSHEVWAKANEVFEYDFVKAFQLKSRTPGALIHNLAPSFAKYNGKDALLVVIKDRKNKHAFFNLEHHPGVKAIPFNQLCPQMRAISETSNHQCAHPNSTDGRQEQYSVSETDAVTKIQRLWRSCFSKIERRHSYVSTSECRATTRLFNSSTCCPATTALEDRKAIRKLLVLQGVSLFLRLLASQETLSSLQTDAMAFIENVEVSVGVFESIDITLGRNREAEALLNEAEKEISDERLNELVKCGVLHDVEDSMKKAETALMKAEKYLKESREILDAMPKKCI